MYTALELVKPSEFCVLAQAGPGRCSVPRCECPMALKPPAGGFQLYAASPGLELQLGSSPFVLQPRFCSLQFASRSPRIDAL